MSMAESALWDFNYISHQVCIAGQYSMIEKEGKVDVVCFMSVWSRMR